MEWNNFILHTFKILFNILAASSLKRSRECIKKQGYLWKLKIHSIDYTLLLDMDMVENESIYFVSKWAFNQIWSNAHKLHHHQHSTLTWCWKLYMLCIYIYRTNAFIVFHSLSLSFTLSILYVYTYIILPPTQCFTFTHIHTDSKTIYTIKSLHKIQFVALTFFLLKWLWSWTNVEQSFITMYDII